MKNVLIFIAGAFVGGLGTWLAMRSMYEVVKNSEEVSDEEKNDIPEKAQGEETQNTPGNVYIRPEKNSDLYRKNETRVPYETFSTPAPEKPSEEEVAEIFPEDEELFSIISADQYLHERPNYEKGNLFFYEPEQILANSDGDIVNDLEAVVGGYYIFDRVGEYAPDSVFVRNVNFRTDYEVHVEHYSFYEREEH